MAKRTTRTGKSNRRVLVYHFLIANAFLILLVPGEPQDFKVVKVTATTIELEWKPPRRDEQASSSSSTHNIKGYEIHYFKVNPSNNNNNNKNPYSSSSPPHIQKQQQQQLESNLNTNSLKAADETQIFKRKTNDIKRLKYTLSDLEPNAMYKIQIFAYNMKGDGQRSNPLLVTTLEEGPSKPEHIRSEIHDELLRIKWQPPLRPGQSDADEQSRFQSIGGYRIYFNNDKYDLDSQSNQITFKRPKWGKSVFILYF